MFESCARMKLYFCIVLTAFVHATAFGQATHEMPAITWEDGPTLNLVLADKDDCEATIGMLSFAKSAAGTSTVTINGTTTSAFVDALKACNSAAPGPIIIRAKVSGPTTVTTKKTGPSVTTEFAFVSQSVCPPFVETALRDGNKVTINEVAAGKGNLAELCRSSKRLRIALSK